MTIFTISSSLNNPTYFFSNNDLYLLTYRRRRGGGGGGGEKKKWADKGGAGGGGGGGGAGRGPGAKKKKVDSTREVHGVYRLSQVYYGFVHAILFSLSLDSYLKISKPPNALTLSVHANWKLYN